MFNASRTMHKTARSGSTGSWGQRAPNRQEETSRFQGHTPFDEGVFDSPSGAVSETSRVGDHVIENAPIALVGGRIRARWCTGYRVARRAPHCSSSRGRRAYVASRRGLRDAPVGRHRVEGALARNQRPYTAVMSVERLTALLAALAPRRLGDIVLHDLDGPSRVVAPFPDRESLAFRPLMNLFLDRSGNRS